MANVAVDEQDALAADGVGGTEVCSNEGFTRTRVEGSEHYHLLVLLGTDEIRKFRTQEAEGLVDDVLVAFRNHHFAIFVIFLLPPVASFRNIGDFSYQRHINYFEVLASTNGVVENLAQVE